MPAGLLSSELSLPWVQIRVWKGVFELNRYSGNIMRLNSRTGIDGLPVTGHYTQE